MPQKEWTIRLTKFPEVAIAFRAAFILLIIILFGGALFGVRVFAADMQFATSRNARAYEKKIVQGEAAVRLNPVQAEYFMALSRNYLARVKEELQKPQEQQNQKQLSLDIQKTITYGRKAVDLAPKRVAVWESLGVVYREIQSAPGAIEWSIRAFKEAIQLEEVNPALHTELGKLYTKTQEFEKARAQFDKAIELKYDYLQALVQLALLAEKEDNRKIAISQLENLVLRYPKEPEILFQVGRLLVNDDQTAKGIVKLEQVIQLLPNHSNAHYTLGVAYERQGKTEQAREQFERVLQLNPGNQEVAERLEQLE